MNAPTAILPDKAILGEKLGNRAYSLNWSASPSDKGSDISRDTGSTGTLSEIFEKKREEYLKLLFGPEATLEMTQKLIAFLDSVGTSGGGSSSSWLSSILPAGLSDMYNNVADYITGSAGSAADGVRARLFLANQYAVIDTLKVDTSPRYQPLRDTADADGDGNTTETIKTYCNIYGHDVARALGGYLPRVWWYNSSIKKIQAGNEVALKYGDPDKGGTVGELNANSLHAWLTTWGDRYGWREAADMEEAQEAANEGKLVVAVARRNNPKRSGHVTVVIKEAPADLFSSSAPAASVSGNTHLASRKPNGALVIPLQSQAGVSNFKYGYRNRWWDDSEHTGGFWIYEGEVDSPIASAEELGQKN